MRQTDLLIIGAGPFGLAIAAQASHLRFEHLIVGKPMDFWHQNMPKGMYLRSACDWHLDPLGVHTIERFLDSLGKTARDVEPLSLDFYLSYAEWFRLQKQIQPLPLYIERLDRSDADDRFIATTASGEQISARQVVLAPGFKHFAHVPEELRPRLPCGRFRHTCEFVDFSDVANKRFLIVGGRQSAFEWAALLIEAGAATVHLSHRHDSPAFTASDWSWVGPLVDGISENPGWFRSLTQSEQESIAHRLWAEGRLKVEPWLESRLTNGCVKVWPRTEVVECVEQKTGALRVRLSNGETIDADQVVLATGYKVNIANVPYLATGNILSELVVKNGFPVLDDHFESSVNGLFITSMPAVQDFGPFLAFTVSVRASAKVICERILEIAQSGLNYATQT